MRKTNDILYHNENNKTLQHNKINIINYGDFVSKMFI